MVLTYFVSWKANRTVIILIIMTSLGRAANAQFLFGPPVKLAEPVNSPNSFDGFSMLTPDGRSMVFSSSRAEGLGATDLFIAERQTVNDPFGEPKRIANVNSAKVDTSPWLSADGLELYFDSRRPTPGNGNSEARKHLWTATRTSIDQQFGEPRYLEELDAMWAEATDPVLSADGHSLYFSNPFDILVSRRESPSDAWGPPESIGDQVNTSAWEFVTSVSSNGLYLFLEDGGSRPGGRGNSDIYVATRRSTEDPWGRAVNLGAVVNGSKEDFGAHLDVDRATLYFSRGDFGTATDLWESQLVPFSSIMLSGKGSTYTQDFQFLTGDASVVGTPFPPGWTFTANEVVFNNATTQAFPTASRRMLESTMADRMARPIVR